MEKLPFIVVWHQTLGDQGVRVSSSQFVPLSTQCLYDPGCSNAVPSPFRSISIAASLVGEDAKTKFLSKMGQLTTSGAMLANVFQRKK